ncbi:hypothetical protein [Gymnodinialimonas ceratoperidinii]|uniref:Uncharacterized protein n=1 Tax=Gymnodinialimonas ceratoperidinii TaxID=2856823 RepID=A0A8F6TT79_9RHOB|nr:hypothetical protein [Gymnodinialimonas ceratoperidinii]QXT38300.1 hypothetical protein KYE46_10075 [Gymnodinialimonas ceratoperidinii]
MSAVAIPKHLGHIWIGDRPAPRRWMDTWRNLHPDWTYTLYDNIYLTGRRWRNQRLMAHYFRKRHFEGVADLMRYEILFERGGFLPGADFEALQPCDALFNEPCTYTCYETHPKRRSKLTPFLASAPETRTLALTIDEIHAQFSQAPETARQPWISVGNLFLRGLVEKYRDQITDLRIWPAYFFVPRHKKGPRYDGPGPIYAEHHWGTTLDTYEGTPNPQLFDDVAYVLEATEPLPLTEPTSEER